MEKTENMWMQTFPEIWDLIQTLYCCALDYELKWARFWPERWGDWDWVKRAMAATYTQLNPEDRSVVQEAYEKFLKDVEQYDSFAL